MIMGTEAARSRPDAAAASDAGFACFLPGERCRPRMASYSRIGRSPRPEAPTMPLYEFHCRRCQHDFELRQSLSEHEAHRPICPSCGARDTEPLLSTFFARTSHKGR